MKKDAAWAEQAARLDKPVTFLLAWYRSIKTRYGKLAKMKSGAGAEKTERDAWNLPYTRSFIVPVLTWVRLTKA